VTPGERPERQIGHTRHRRQNNSVTDGDRPDLERFGKILKTQMVIFRAHEAVALFLFRSHAFAKSNSLPALFLSDLLEIRLLSL
jgi:hypothetical protein